MNTHHFVIEPLRGVGPIRFGMHKDEVSCVFKYVYTSFFKVETSKVRSDHCEVVGLIVHYDDQSRVNYVEIVKPLYAKELFGRNVTGISVRDAFALLSSHSTTHTKDQYGYDFPDLGINIFNHDLESEDQPIECLGIGTKNPG